MRSIYVSCLFSITFLIISHNCYSSYFELGIKGQLGGIQITRVDNTSYDYQLGYGFGVSLTLIQSKFLMVELDTLVMVRGSRTSEGNTITLNNLSFPLLIKSDPLDLGVFFSIGFQLNINIKALSDDRYRHTEFITSDVKGANYDIIFGIGYQIDFLSFEFRYELGLSDIFKNESKFGNVIEKNNSFFFVLGANFKL